MWLAWRQAGDGLREPSPGEAQGAGLFHEDLWALGPGGISGQLRVGVAGRCTWPLPSHLACPADFPVPHLRGAQLQSY